MRKILIKGRKRLEGEVSISGSKNAALAVLASTILLPGKSVIRNVPNLLDVKTIIRVLRALGMRAEYSGSQPNMVEVWNQDVRHVAPYELVTKLAHYLTLWLSGSIPSNQQNFMPLAVCQFKQCIGRIPTFPLADRLQSGLVHAGGYQSISRFF